MTSSPPGLLKGDRIEIVAPAKAIEEEHIRFTKSYLEKEGFVVTISEHCLGRENYFSGSISDRLQDFQKALDNPDVKAILCARGGYGCVQLVDELDWNHFSKYPKWIIGFSDITVFHQRIAKLGAESIHGTMPLNFSSNTEEALNTLLSALSGQHYSITADTAAHNIQGKSEGRLLGGNLSILFSLIGTNDQVDYSGSILFIEDLAEHLYHIDRIFYALRKAGILDTINGLIVGGMTQLKDTEQPFGKEYEEIILSHVEGNNYPVCFNFPAGHIDDNRALVLNKKVTLEVSGSGTVLQFTE